MKSKIVILFFLVYFLLSFSQSLAEIKTRLTVEHPNHVSTNTKVMIKASYTDDSGKPIENSNVRIINPNLDGYLYEKDNSCEETNFQSELNSVTQTFIPTRDNIAKIDLNLRKGRESNFNIFINLKDCEGNILGISSKLESSVMPIQSYTFKWYDFVFNPVVKTNPGEKYVIEIICEGDCGRLSEVEDQIAHTYTSNDDCDKTGYIGKCETAGQQDLSYRIYYGKKSLGNSDMFWNITSKTYDYGYLAEKSGKQNFTVIASKDEFQTQTKDFEIEVKSQFNLWLLSIPIILVLFFILRRWH